MSDDKENFIEKTTEIKQGHADVGVFVKARLEISILGYGSQRVEQ